MSLKFRLTKPSILGASAVTLVIMIVAQSLLAQGAASSNEKVQTVATLTSSGNLATENISQTADGSFYITALSDRILWKIHPDGKVEKFYTLPSAAAFLGVATNQDEIVVGIFQRPFMVQPPAGSAPPAAGAPPTRLQFNLADVGSAVVVLDKAGKVKATIEGEKGQVFNGIVPAGKGSFIVADSNGPALLRVDTVHKRVEPWLKDDRLAPAADFPFGANGIKIHNGWLYVGNSSARTIYRVQMDSKGQPKGELTEFAKAAADDFAIAPDGTMYIPTGTTMMKVSPAGEVSKFLDDVPRGPAAWVDKDGKWLYWPTREGASRARLVRVPIP